jgi:hypothetical protein
VLALLAAASAASAADSPTFHGGCATFVWQLTQAVSRSGFW